MPTQIGSLYSISKSLNYWRPDSAFYFSTLRLPCHIRTINLSITKGHIHKPLSTIWMHPSNKTLSASFLNLFWSMCLGACTHVAWTIPRNKQKNMLETIKIIIAQCSALTTLVISFVFLVGYRKNWDVSWSQRYGTECGPHGMKNGCLKKWTYIFLCVVFVCNHRSEGQRVLSERNKMRQWKRRENIVHQPTKMYNHWRNLAQKGRETS